MVDDVGLQPSLKYEPSGLYNEKVLHWQSKNSIRTTYKKSCSSLFDERRSKIYNLQFTFGSLPAKRTTTELNLNSQLANNDFRTKSKVPIVSRQVSLKFESVIIIAVAPLLHSFSRI